MARAVARAINRSLTGLRAQASREVAKGMGLRVRDVKKRMVITQKARARRRVGRLRGRGRPLNLMKFAGRKVRRGVSAKPWGKRRIFKDGIISRGNAYIRSSDPGRAVRPMWGPGVARQFSDYVEDRRNIRALRRRLRKEVAAAYKFLARTRG